MTYTATAGEHSPSLTRFEGPHITLHFQDGPIGVHGVNGTTNEEVLDLVTERITSLNTMDGGKYACPENEVALTYLRAVRRALEERTRLRMARGVEGTNTP